MTGLPGPVGETAARRRPAAAAHGSAWSRVRARAAALPEEAPLLAVILAALAAFLAAGFVRLRNLAPGAFDLGIFDQLAWNLAHGRAWQTTFVSTSYEGEHLSPVLWLFAPGYRLGAGPELLIAVQAVAVTLAALPLYRAARAFGAGQRLAFAVGAAWLFNPYVHRAVNYDFHPEVMVALPAFASAWALAAGRPRTAALLAVSCLAFKEDSAFVTLALGALIAVHGARREGALVASIALAWAVMAFLVWIPEARDGQPSHIVERYGAVAGTTDPHAVLRELLLHPWRPALALLEPARLERLVVFVIVTAPLALVLRPWLLLFALPALAVPLLSSHPPQGALDLHYAMNAVVAATAVAVGAIPVAVRVFARAGQLRARQAPAFVLALATVAFTALSPFAPWRIDLGEASPVHRAAVAEAVSLVPGEAPVAAQSNLVPRLSRRAQIHEFPGRPEGLHYVLLDRYGHRSVQSLNAGFDAYAELVRENCARQFERDGVEVFLCPGVNRP